MNRKKRFFKNVSKRQKKATSQQLRKFAKR